MTTRRSTVSRVRRAESLLVESVPWRPAPPALGGAGLARVGRIALAIAALVLAAGVAAPARAQDKAAHDPAVLSEIARDILRRAATGPAQSVSEPASAATLAPEPKGAAAEPELPPNVIQGSPGGPATSVSAPATISPPKDAASISAPAGYMSNSWRQAPAEFKRSLTFSTGAYTPGPGLDPAMKQHGLRARTESRAHVYGFVLFRSEPDQATLQKVERLGVRFLGRHDNHEKVRVPVGAIDAVAALPEVEWLGTSVPEQKLSLELSDVHQPRAAGAPVDETSVIPIAVNLFEPDGDGGFRRALEAAGAVVAEYDARLHFYRAVAARPVIDRIVALDFVLFVELIRPTSGTHDQSTTLIDADLIRPGGSFLPRYGGTPATLGILDSGFALSAAPVPHDDLLSKNGCGNNYTSDAAGVWSDQRGHGSHVLGTIAGTGTAKSRYRGVATGVGSNSRIRAAKVFNSFGNGTTAWTESGMDYMAVPMDCDSPAPLVVNLSGGTSGTNLTGTDTTSRKLDDLVWNNRQAWVVAAGNEGGGAGTVRTPGVAKNALTVGNVLDRSYLSVGDIASDSSRGPTGDNRMKPNLVAPGNLVKSVRAGTTNDYIDMAGTSMATPHVTGLAATLMEHRPEFQNNPALLRAHLMASTIAHDDVTGKSNDYGVGRVSSYMAHWPTNDFLRWWTWGSVSATGWHFFDINVPAGAQRMVVVMTWDEPAASAGASQAVTWDVDLYVDYLADCSDPKGACGEWSSISGIDNVEYIVINNPPAGLYRLQASNFRAPSTFSLPVGIGATVIMGDPTPAMSVSLSAPSSVLAGQAFTVTGTVTTPSYLASGVQATLTGYSAGLTLINMFTERYDGVTTVFPPAEITTDTLTLGNVFPGVSRSVSWQFRADTTGTKVFNTRFWSENGGTQSPSATSQVDAPLADLVVSSVTTTPAAPFLLPGGTFSVTDRVVSDGSKSSVASTTRYYLSFDGAKNAGDTLLAATRAVPALHPGAGSTGTVVLTIPPNMALNTYFLLACADDLNTNAEENETNNCAVATTGAITVTRPNLVEASAAMTPTSPVRAVGGTFSVTDTVFNVGQVAAGTSTTRYYLSIDGAKSAGDILLTGSRPVPGLAKNTSNSGTATVTIPTTTPVGTYYLLACADDLNAVIETDNSNCVFANPGQVTVTRPDLIMSTVSTNPATMVRAPGGTFSVTDATLNAGQSPSGASTTRYYLSLNGSKDAGDVLLTGTRTVPALAAGASHSGTVTVTIPATTPLNNYVVLACADDTLVVTETVETNNCLAASGVAAVRVTRADLTETSAFTTPAAPVRAPGTTFSITDTARNVGAVASTPSTTRYYLSLNQTKGAGDILLTGARTVPALAENLTSTAAVTVTIPSTTPVATYFVLACADDISQVVEIDETNNCVASSSGQVVVTRPDLVAESVTPPPTSKARGTSFPVTDVVRNIGAVSSAASTTRYYLSLDTAKAAGDTLLTGSRTAAALAPNATSSATVTVVIPTSTPLGTFFLLACADDTNQVVETNNANNCTAAATPVTITP